MMRSLYSGVSGLQNHQTRMDVIGNNISNVNTTGFKRGRVNFQDMISQQMSGSARPTEEKGGVNPKEVGLGMSIASIDTIFTQGNLQSTGVATDLAIQGNGFFVLKNGDQTLYTRAGVFGVDSNGTLVNPANGLRVQGWMAQDFDGTQIIQNSATPTDITIPVGQKDPPKATTMVNYACNLNKNTPEIPDNANDQQIMEGTWQTSVEIYDSYGNTHILQMNFTKVPGNPNQWTASINVDPDNADFTQTRVGFNTTDGVDNTYTLNFDNYGTLQSVTDSAGNVTNPEGSIILQASYTVPDSNPDADGNPYRQSFSLNLGTIGSMENTITQSASKSTTRASYQDGYALGYRAGAKLIDMELVQFHPTGAVYPIDSRGRLITEAVRGEGGILRNVNGERFMERYDPVRLELSTRDIVARSIATEVLEGRGTPNGGVYLDVTHLSREQIETRLPIMLEQFLTYGVDIREKPMEVAPTAHHFMGGLKITPNAETTIPRLFAAGEVCGGVHGGNRLGGNALAETQVFGKRAGEAAGKCTPQSISSNNSVISQLEEKVKKWQNGTISITEARKQLKLLMWNNVGIYRNELDLKVAKRDLASLRSKTLKISSKKEIADAFITENMLLVASLVIEGALLRRESRGSHARTDIKQSWTPDKSPFGHTWFQNDKAGIEIREEFL